MSALTTASEDKIGQNNDQKTTNQTTTPTDLTRSPESTIDIALKSIESTPDQSTPNSPTNESSPISTSTVASKSSSISTMSRTDLINTITPILESFTTVQNYTFDENKTSIWIGTCIPCITMKDYLVRLIVYGKLSHASVIVALIYLDRLMSNSALEITNWTVHRIVLSACVLAAKFQDDDYYNNHHMAAVGGVTNLELNDMEVDMLVSLNFSLWVSPHVFERYEDLILNEEDVEVDDE